MYPTVTMPMMLKVREAADAFHIGQKTIRQAVYTGKLPSYRPNGKTHLLKADEIQAWIETTRYRTGLEEA